MEPRIRLRRGGPSATSTMCRQSLRTAPGVRFRAKCDRASRCAQGQIQIVSPKTLLSACVTLGELGGARWGEMPLQPLCVGAPVDSCTHVAALQSPEPGGSRARSPVLRTDWNESRRTRLSPQPRVSAGATKDRSHGWSLVPAMRGRFVSPRLNVFSRSSTEPAVASTRPRIGQSTAGLMHEWVTGQVRLGQAA